MPAPCRRRAASPVAWRGRNNADVARAFRYYIAHGKRRPSVLIAAHSQGANARGQAAPAEILATAPAGPLGAYAPSISGDRLRCATARAKPCLGTPLSGDEKSTASHAANLRQSRVAAGVQRPPAQPRQPCPSPSQAPTKSGRTLPRPYAAILPARCATKACSRSIFHVRATASRCPEPHLAASSR